MLKKAFILAVAFLVCLGVFVPSPVHATSYTYWGYGPSSEIGATPTTGTPPVTNVTITIYDGTPHTVQYNGSFFPLLVPITAGELGSIRVWMPDNTSRYILPRMDNETIYFFVPESPYTTYYVDLVDMVGLNNAYIESYVTLSGIAYTVERRLYRTGNLVPFIMTEFATYGFRLTSDQGDYDFGKVSLGDPSIYISLSITPLSFPSTAITYGNLTLSAQRMNSSWIRTQYVDSGNNTSNMNVSITDMTSSTVEYSANYATSTVSLDWYDAVPSRDYYVTIAISHPTYGTLTYQISVPASASYTSPFSLSFLGLFPFDSAQLVGFVLVMFVYGGFSIKDHAVGLILAIVLAAFLAFIGWLAVGWATITAVLVLAIMYALSRRRPS